jgi:hypothetical protein
VRTYCFGSARVLYLHAKPQLIKTTPGSGGPTCPRFPSIYNHAQLGTSYPTDHDGKASNEQGGKYGQQGPDCSEYRPHVCIRPRRLACRGADYVHGLARQSLR